MCQVRFDEFCVVVGLNRPDSVVELSAYIREEVMESGCGVGFLAKREGPQEVREVIKHNKIILKS